MTEKDDFICTTCHKEFKRQENLSRHLLTHTNEKSFQCNETGKHVQYSLCHNKKYLILNMFFYTYRL